MSTDEQQKEIEDKSAADEIARLKMHDDSIKKALDTQLQRNQQNELVFNKMSALLGELLTVNARTTYIATMLKDIVDSRNHIQ